MRVNCAPKLPMRQWPMALRKKQRSGCQEWLENIISDSL
jgi:hypothetical protein